MTKIEKFEDILVWQKSKTFIENIYNEFRNCKDYSFRDQIQRASVSITNNIAEGYEKMGNKEFNKFLYISKGSCGEVRSMLHLVLDLGYINKEKFDLFFNQSIEISKILSGFIKKLK